MPHFITRIELHRDFSRENYDKLHALMLGRGFKRTIEASDGTDHHLPSATYMHYETSTQVLFNLKKLTAALDAAGFYYQALMTQDGGSAFTKSPVSQLAGLLGRI